MLAHRCQSFTLSFTTAFRYSPPVARFEKCIMLSDKLQTWGRRYYRKSTVLCKEVAQISSENLAEPYKDQNVLKKLLGTIRSSPPTLKNVRKMDRGNFVLDLIKDTTPSSPETLYTPQKDFIKLPFPTYSRNFPNDRFSIRQGYWEYMPRQKFAELLEKTTEMLTGSKSELWFYGTMGFGKSHVLAALVCFLIKSGQRVVYIPDCRTFWHNPVRSLVVAMTITWAEYPAILDVLKNVTTPDELVKFIERVDDNLIFVFDQMNEVEAAPGDTDVVKDSKSVAHKIIAECKGWHGTDAHKQIFSTSANNMTYLKLQRSGSNVLRVNAYGGLSTEEVAFWWTRNSPNLETSKKELVEDRTGRIPLLLDGSIIDGRINLHSPVLKAVSANVKDFAKKANRELNIGELAQYHMDMNACISGSNIGNDGLSSNIDHRYFYTEEHGLDMYARYTCGSAREAMVDYLWKSEGLSTFPEQYTEALISTKLTAPIIGFLVELAVLSTIQVGGINIGIAGLNTPMRALELTPNISAEDRQCILYVPRAHNYGGIDGIIVQTDNMNSTIYPIQITISKTHSNSEASFFCSPLWEVLKQKNFSQNIHFLWIVEKDARPATTVHKDTLQQRKMRKPGRPQKVQGTEEADIGKFYTVVHPEYTTRRIVIQDAFKNIWRDIDFQKRTFHND